MRSLIFVFCLISFGGCSTSKIDGPIKAEFLNKYDKTDKGLSQLINIDGVYVFTNNPESECYAKYLFFKDGTFFNGIVIVDKLSQKPINEFWEIPFDYKRHILGTTMGTGFYTVKGDTIIAKSATFPHHPNQMIFMQRYFKIVNRQSLKIIKEEITGDTKIVGNCTDLKFFYWGKLPPEDNWMMYKSWYWKNHKDWEQFMASHKNGLN